MASIPKWRRYLRFWRPDAEADVDDELQTHLDLRVAELRERGFSAAEARGQALAEFGDVDATRHRLYEIGHRLERRRARFLWWEAARSDLRYALRGLLASPLFTATVVLTLAVGIGAAATMYGVMRRLLIQPPPHVAAPERVVGLRFQAQRGSDPARTGDATSYPVYTLFRQEARTLAGVAAYDHILTVPVGRGADAELARGTMVSAGFWRTLGVQPRLGRFLADDEAHPATGSRVVVLGHAFWQRRFGGDPDVLGRTLPIRGVPYEIVGVAPRGFRGVELRDTDVWLPLFARSDDGRNTAATWHESARSYNLRLVARVRPGVSPAQARSELSRLYAEAMQPEFRASDREASTRWSVRVAGITGALGSDMQRLPEATVSLWLVGVAGVLLTVACANVGGLLLLRALRRRREIAVRLALGMSRRRLAALLFTESALLALCGGLAAAAVVVWGGAWVRRVLLADMLTESAGPDWRLLLVATACTVGTALVTGMMPVLQLRRDDIGGLRDGAQHGTTRRSPVFRTLLVAQTALSVVLLLGAGLFLRSIHRITTLDLGMDVRNVLTVEADFTSLERTEQERGALLERALERVRGTPGVVQASLATQIPLRTATAGTFRRPGSGDWVTVGTDGAMPMQNTVADGFVAATGMRLLQGRDFTAQDRTTGDVIIINETLARAAWPDGSPVGECVELASAEGTCATVVGVVADARTFHLREEARGWLYTPLPAGDPDARVLLVRTMPGVRGVRETVRRTIQELEPVLPFVDVRLLGDALDPQMRPWRLGATLFTLFGVLAALLAAVGLYAAVSYAVAQRTREIGVRLAVGARAHQVVTLVIGDGFRTAMVGTSLGVIIGLAGAPRIADLLFDVSPRDPLVYVAVGGGILLAALLASLVPARRAARVDPMIALRTE